MCDWSINACKTRDAKIDDQLVSGKIQTMNGSWKTSTRGFHSPAEPDVAICLRPGTELAFEEPVTFEVGVVAHTSRYTTAIFREHNLDCPHVHHDTLEFPDGSRCLVHDLNPGQRARVLQLGVEPKLAKSEGRVEATV